MFIIGGVSAEDISCDDDSEIQVSEVQTEISSNDIVSSNYLTDSEVSHTSQVDDNINDECSDNTEEISSTIDVDEISYDYSVSSDLEDTEALSPTLEVGSSKVMSIDYSVASTSDLEGNNQVEIPAVDVGNSKFISLDYTASSSLGDDGMVTPTLCVGNCEFMSVDYSDSINQCPTCEINSIDDSDVLYISISAQNCIIQEDLDNFDLYECILADVSSDMEASESSKLGRKVIASAKLNFESVEDVFLITKEGILKLDCKAIEPVIKSIFDDAGYISHEEVYLGKISESMQNSDMNEVFMTFKTEGLKFISFVDGFDYSIGLNVLQKTYSHSQNSGKITKELLQYYPPANKGNIIVMEEDSNLLGSNDEDEQCLGISYADSIGIDLCNPLWFNFILKQSDGSLMSIYMRYNEDNFFIEGYNWTQTYNLMSTLYNSTLSSGMSKSAYPDRIDKAIDTDQWSNQELSNYATSESIGAAQSQDLSSIDLLNSLEGINNEDLLKSVATNIDNAKDNTKTNMNTSNTKCKSCKCVNCNHTKCDCLKCNCSNMNCSDLNNSNCHCNCSHKNGKRHHNHGRHGHGYRKYIRYEYIRDVVNKIGDSYGMLADNSTDENSTDNVTATTKGPLNIPKPVHPTNFNTLIISIAGVLVLGVLFGISHRRQQN